MSFMLSLASNPYNPFTEYNKWVQYDNHEGFDTAGLFARAISTSSEISEPDQDLAEQLAAESIANNPSFEGLYVVVESQD